MIFLDCQIKNFHFFVDLFQKASIIMEDTCRELNNGALVLIDSLKEQNTIFFYH